MAKKLSLIAASFVFAVWSASAIALERVFENPQDFINRQFTDPAPQASFIYPDTELRKQIRAILNHDYSRFRIRYWDKGATTVWLLEEIGKELPITVGFAVNNDRLITMKVLIFRESRGWEIKYDSFTRQFIGAKLTKSHKLDRKIDGITGATLSTQAAVKLVRLALLLNGSITKP